MRRRGAPRRARKLVALAVAKTERMEIAKPCLFRDRRGGGGIDAAAQQDDGGVPAIDLRARHFAAFHRVAFLVPADEAFIEHFHIAITVLVEYAISQTGQVMGACSIEHHRPVARDAF